MKFCTHCGKELMDEAVICPNCGCAVNGANAVSGAVEGDDVPSIGLNILSLLIPIVGLILFCVMHGKTPKKAKQIGIFTLIGWIIAIIFFAWAGLF